MVYKDSPEFNYNLIDNPLFISAINRGDFYTAYKMINMLGDSEQELILKALISRACNYLNDDGYFDKAFYYIYIKLFHLDISNIFKSFDEMRREYNIQFEVEVGSEPTLNDYTIDSGYKGMRIINPYVNNIYKYYIIKNSNTSFSIVGVYGYDSSHKVICENVGWNDFLIYLGNEFKFIDSKALEKLKI